MVEYNYAVFTESVFGRRTFQGFGRISQTEWLPVDFPKPSHNEAVLDCTVAHKEIEKRGIRQYFRIDPDLRMFDWSGPRRMLK